MPLKVTACDNVHVTIDTFYETIDNIDVMIDNDHMTMSMWIVYDFQTGPNGPSADCLVLIHSIPCLLVPV